MLGRCCEKPGTLRQGEFTKQNTKGKKLQRERPDLVLSPSINMDQIIRMSEKGKLRKTTGQNKPPSSTSQVSGKGPMS